MLDANYSARHRESDKSVAMRRLVLQRNQACQRTRTPEGGSQRVHDHNSHAARSVTQLLKEAVASDG
jgi:hypothetical protein